MLRNAVISDVPSILEIYNDAVLNSTATFDLETKTLEDRIKWFNNHTKPHILLVDDNNGIITGYASLSHYREKPAYDTTAEFSVYIKKDFRRNNIGFNLSNAVIEYAEDCESINNIVSVITADNIPSIKLHEKLGFDFCGTIKQAGRKFGKMLDVYIYQLIV